MIGKHRQTLATLGMVFFALVPSAGAFTTVVIDPGHGGHDLGAAEALVYEKHVNLDVARRLERALRENGFRVVMTRSKDNFVELRERAEIANRHRDSIFISIHFNHSWKNQVSGIETFYYGSAGFELAEMVQKQLIDEMKPVDRGVKRASFAVLRRTRAPACLVEGGFVSNPDDRDAMKAGKHRQRIADAIAAAVILYKKTR